MKDKKLQKKIILYLGFIGAFIGAFPPWIFTILTIVALPGTAAYIAPGAFKLIYHFRMIAGVVTGTLVGGFSSALATKLGISIMGDNMKWYKGFILGLVFGGIAGLLTAGSTPLALLINSTDLVWAIEVIKRGAIAGCLFGAFAGASLGTLGTIYYNRKIANR